MLIPFYLNLQFAIISVKQATILISWSATKADLYWYPAITNTAWGTELPSKFVYNRLYIVENKEDLLLKASEVPSIVFEVLDELRSYSKNKNSSEEKIKKLEIQLSRQKYLMGVIGLGIILIIAVIVMV